MSEKHTPGPWVDDSSEHTEPYCPIKIKGGHHTICTVYIDDAPVEDYNREQYANAALIASAPNLLKEVAELRAENVRLKRKLTGLLSDNRWLVKASRKHLEQHFGLKRSITTLTADLATAQGKLDELRELVDNAKAVIFKDYPLLSAMLTKGLHESYRTTLADSEVK